MNKKLLRFIFASALVLSACSSDGSEANETSTETQDTTQQAEETATETQESKVNSDVGSDETPQQQAGDVIEAEGGTREIIATNYDINETQESGPFTITVKHAQLSQFQPNEDFIEMFGGENLATVTIQVEVTNDSEETNTIHPDQGTIVTNTGDQVDANLLLSDQVGGEFFGEVTKSGDVFFFFDKDAKEINNVRYIVGSGSDEDYNSFGENLEFTIEF